ncbi:hypothetical protein [Jiangella asiatica]|uniref:Phospholipase n=1 Tax=Jiangella asiatica TaxID=2530372 RepID=A0A4R5CDW4_9ACTN|nr:hypothetical protein [Jiangella asiatica]TDD98251.1 hypothetical protein E1269_28840 [Jiangella asiatica]
MGIRIGRLLGALLLSLTLSAAGTAPPSGRSTENAAAARAVIVLTGATPDSITGSPVTTHGEPPTAPDNRDVANGAPALAGGDLAGVLPADFAAVMGYVPQMVTGEDGAVHLIDADGGCSWLGNTSYGFDRACQSHDLGYDLLRYAADRGDELGSWARRAVDDRLSADLRARCDEVDGGAACRALAGAAQAAVTVNSWRQGYGVPREEQPWPYLLAAALVVVASVASLAGGRRNRTPRELGFRPPRPAGTPAAGVPDRLAGHSTRRPRRAGRLPSDASRSLWVRSPRRT